MHSEFGRSWRVFLKNRFNIDCTDRRYDTVSVNAQLLLFPKMNKSWCETGPFCRHYHFTWDVSLSCWRFIKWNLKFMQNLTFSQICSWILYLKSGKSRGVNIPACLFKVTEYNLLHLVCIFLAVKKIMPENYQACWIRGEKAGMYPWLAHVPRGAFRHVLIKAH